MAVCVDAMTRRAIPNDQSAKSAVGDEDVGTETEHEVRDAVLSRQGDRSSELVGVARFIEQVRRAADLERGERRKHDIASNARSAKGFNESSGVHNARGRHAGKEYRVASGLV